VESEGGGTRLHYVHNSLWKRLWTCREIKYEMNCEQILPKSKHTAFFNFHCYNVHVVQLLNYYTNCCIYIKFTH